MTSVDALVIGAGPAGATSARLLAAWGHSVLLVARPAPVRAAPALAESIPPSASRMLARLDALAAVAAAGFLRSSGNTSWWASDTPRVERFDERSPAAWQVLRPRFDQVLLALATGINHQSPLRLVHAVVTRVDLARDGASVDLDTAGSSERVRARFVLDCSGRAGVVARKLGRTADGAYRTRAVVGVWRARRAWRLPRHADATHTLVEAFDRGWAWSVPVSRETRYVAVMIDPPERRAPLGDTYASELTRAPQLSRVIDGASPVGAPWACDASTYASEKYAGPGWLLVGDAGSFLDALSSYGVKKALVSAWRAAVVVNTALRRPAMESAALALHDAREREIHAHYVAQSRRYFEDAAAHFASPFWAARVDATRAAAITALAPEEDNPVAGRAFDELRASARVRLRPAAGLRTRTVPDVVGREVVLCEALASDRLPAGIRFVSGVDVTRLVRLSSDGCDVPVLFDRYNRSSPPVGLPAFLGAVSVLLASGLLENEVRS